jgi:hypothetical protein
VSDSVLVCAAVGFYGDEVHGACADCSDPIVWRPHAPAGVRLCVACAAVRLLTGDAEEFDIEVTPETQRELAGWRLLQQPIDPKRKPS